MVIDYAKTAFVLNLWLGLLSLSNAFLRNFWPQLNALTYIVYIVIFVSFIVLNALVIAQTLMSQSKPRLSATLRRINRSTRIS